MSFILTECLPYSFLLWDGILRQPDLDHLVLCACETVATAS